MKIERDSKAREIERAAKALDNIEANVAVLDHQGFIITTNKSWRDFANKNPLVDGSPPQKVSTGSSYLDVCLEASGPTSESAVLAYEGIKAVLDGKKNAFCLEYPCHSPNQRRWFSMKVKPLPRSKPREVVVIHANITEQRLAEMESLSKQKELSAALAQLQTFATEINRTLMIEKPFQSTESETSLQAIRPQRTHQSDAALLQSLSNRELEVLMGIVRGERNAATATRLDLSKKSISTYRSRVLEKLKADGDAQLIGFATRMGLK